MGREEVMGLAITEGKFSRMRIAAPWVMLALTLTFALAVHWRLRTIPLERDEGEFAYSAQLLLKGFPPYHGAYVQKFPGTSVMYALIIAAFGQTPAGIHLGL